MGDAPLVFYRGFKDGEYVRIVQHGGPVFKKNDQTYPPLPALLSAAADSESFFYQGELRTQFIPIALLGRDVLIDRDERDDILGAFLETIVDAFGGPDGRPSSSVRRRASASGRKPGRRELPPLALLVWFNLPYDITRIFSEREQLQAIYSGVSNHRMRIGERWEIEWVRFVDKSAPYAEWIVRDRVHRRIAHVLNSDLTGYWKTSLDGALQGVGLLGKLDIDAAIADAFERAYETFSPEEKAQLKSYAIRDARQTLALYHKTVELLRTIDLRVVRKNGTIPPSAPAAAAKLMFARAFDAHPEIEEWPRPPQWADNLGSIVYLGGRAFATKPGITTNLLPLDEKSAYPFGMSQLPDPVTARYHQVEPEVGFSLAEWRGRFGALWIDGESVDDLYPAFRRHGDDGRLRYVFGRFQKLAVTIPEIAIGVARGSLRVDKIRGGYWIEGDPETSFFRRSVLDLYDIKEREGKGPLGNLAKLLMNATYGKLIEVVRQELAYDSLLQIPCFAKYQTPIAKSLILLAVDPEADSSQLFFDRDAGAARRLRVLFEERRKATFVRNDGPSGPLAAETYAETLAETHPFDGFTSLRDFARGARRYRAGNYFMPSYGAQITGLASAILGSMAACTQADCGDTDSVHIGIRGYENDPLGHPGVLEHFRVMDRAGYLAPRRGRDGQRDVLVAPGCTLGTWEVDAEKPSVESIVVRPKRYSHYFGPTPDLKKIPYKQASHGLARFDCPEAQEALNDTDLSKIERGYKARALRAAALHDAMRALHEGRRPGYISRAAPVKGRSAARGMGVPGAFVTRAIWAENTPVAGTWQDESGLVRWAPLELPPPRPTRARR